MKRKNERKKNGRIQFYKMRGEKKKYAFNHQMDSVSLMRMLVAWVGHGWVGMGLGCEGETKIHSPGSTFLEEVKNKRSTT